VRRRESARRAPGQCPRAEWFRAAPRPIVVPRVIARSIPFALFGIEIEGCARCGGKLKVIASIEESEVIARILAHLEKTAPDQSQPELPLGARAPPSQARLL
jgi:hypothetical protein